VHDFLQLFHLASPHIADFLIQVAIASFFKYGIKLPFPRPGEFELDAPQHFLAYGLILIVRQNEDGANPAHGPFLVLYDTYPAG